MTKGREAVSLKAAAEQTPLAGSCVLMESAALFFVIPSEAEGFAVHGLVLELFFSVPSENLAPEAAVEGAVLNGFRDMAYGDGGLSIEVRNGAGDLQYPIVRARTQALLLHRSLQQTFGFRRELTVGADLASMHLRVGKDTVADETLVLPLPRCQDTRPYLFRSFAGCTRPKLPVLHCGNLNVDINSIQQGT
jgi:hypothetical protein